MNPQGVERVQRFPLPKAQHPCRFACDGLGRILLAHDEETYCFENGSLSPLGFHILSGDGFNGSIPVPGTGRLVMCGFSDREVVARLLELDIDTRRCRATRMQNVDPWSVLLPFGEDWVLVKDLAIRCDWISPGSGIARRAKCYASVPGCSAAKNSNISDG